MYDWRVEVFLSDMVDGYVFGCLCCVFVIVSANFVLEVVVVDIRIKPLPLQ